MSSVGGSVGSGIGGDGDNTDVGVGTTNNSTNSTNNTNNTVYMGEDTVLNRYFAHLHSLMDSKPPSKTPKTTNTPNRTPKTPTTPTDRSTLHMCMDGDSGTDTGTNGCRLWCPRMYEEYVDEHGESNTHSNTHNTHGNTSNSNTHSTHSDAMRCVGRLLVYQHGRFCVCFLVPDWDMDSDSDTTTSTNNTTGTTTTTGTGTGAVSETLNPNANVYTSFATQANATAMRDSISKPYNTNNTTINSNNTNSNNTNITSSNQGDAAVVVMCGALQRALGDELDRLYGILCMYIYQPTYIIIHIYIYISN